MNTQPPKRRRAKSEAIDDAEDRAWIYTTLLVSTPLARAICVALSDCGLTPATASRRAGLHSDFVRNIFRGLSRDPRSAKLAALAKVIKAPVGTLLASTAADGSGETRTVLARIVIEEAAARRHTPK